MQARTDDRVWATERRARTRQLIELGGLIQKVGLVELTGDDRSVLLGALQELADRLRADDGVHQAELWRRRGRRIFEQDRAIGNAE